MSQEQTLGDALMLGAASYLILAIGLVIVVLTYCVNISLRHKPRITWTPPSIASVVTAIFLAFVLGVIAMKSYNKGYADACEHIYRELIK